MENKKNISFMLESGVEKKEEGRRDSVESRGLKVKILGGRHGLKKHRGSGERPLPEQEIFGGLK